MTAGHGRKSMDKVKKKSNRNKGSMGYLSVECMLVLIPFLLAFFTLINFSRYVQAEMIIHHAITQTAKEISAYSYVATKTGIEQQMQNTNKKAVTLKTNVSNVVDSIAEFSSAMEGGNVSDMINSGEAAYSNTKVLVDDAKNIPGEILALLKSGVQQSLARVVIGTITKASIKKELKLTGYDADEYLKDVGVIGGLAGLNFEKSEWNSTASRPGNVRIVVTYKMKNLFIPIMDFGTYEMMLCADTLIW